MSASLSRHPPPISFCIPSNSTSILSSSRSMIIAVPSAAPAVSLLSRTATSKGFEVKTDILGYGPTPVSAIPSSSSMFSTLSNHEEAVELLPASSDAHGGVIVDMKVPMDPDAFISSLKASIAHWRNQGKKGVWIKLPIELVNLVQVAVEEGFWYHHAEPTHLMLVYWIPDTVHTLPPNATHRVGVGGFVLNDRREVLVVQEKGGKLRGMGVWKFPTGVVNDGEDIFAAAVREVREETGVYTEFVEVLAFRHLVLQCVRICRRLSHLSLTLSLTSITNSTDTQSHKSFFEKSDLYFICMLRPLSSDIQKQESEIDAAQACESSGPSPSNCGESIFWSADPGYVACCVLEFLGGLIKCKACAGAKVPCPGKPVPAIPPEELDLDVSFKFRRVLEKNKEYFSMYFST